MQIPTSSRHSHTAPPEPAGTRRPLAGALQQPATQAVQTLLGRPRVQQVFINASTIAHEKLVNVLENKTGHGLSTANGVVTLDLSVLITSVATRLGLPEAAIAKIPPDAGMITVMKSSQLSTAQTAVRSLKVLSTWLLVLVLGLYAVALYLARGIRRETLRNIGWAFVIVGILVLIVRRAGGNYTVKSLTEPQYRTSAHHVFLIGSSILGQIGWATFSYGIVAVLGAVLAGPTRYATVARRHLAPTLNEQQGLVWLGAGVVYLLLVFWGPTHALRTVWGVLLLGALLACGIWALRQRHCASFRRRHGRAHPDGLTNRAPHIDDGG